LYFCDIQRAINESIAREDAKKAVTEDAQKDLTGLEDVVEIFT
jgi:hypothetical protein